jgi:hypothetical protein
MERVIGSIKVRMNCRGGRGSDSRNTVTSNASIER